MTIYVFDTSAFAVLFRSFYPSRFPTLWDQFNALIDGSRIVSTREVRREIEDREDQLRGWARQNSHVFTTPTRIEGEFVAGIFRIEHFRANIEQRKMLKGGKNADPFVIAKAATTEDGCVVTLEQNRPNAARIPNICDHFGVPCLNLEQFMEAEQWKF